MNKYQKLAASILCAPAAIATAAEFDGSKPMACATLQIYECTPELGCEQVRAKSINAPNFLHFDVKKKVVRGEAMGILREAGKIDEVETRDSTLFLSGLAGSSDGVDEGDLAWSVAINQDTGDMVMTATGSDVAFSIFGTCTVN